MADFIVTWRALLNLRSLIDVCNLFDGVNRCLWIVYVPMFHSGEQCLELIRVCIHSNAVKSITVWVNILRARRVQESNVFTWWLLRYADTLVFCWRFWRLCFEEVFLWRDGDGRPYIEELQYSILLIMRYSE